VAVESRSPSPTLTGCVLASSETHRIYFPEQYETPRLVPVTGDGEWLLSLGVPTLDLSISCLVSPDTATLVLFLPRGIIVARLVCFLLQSASIIKR
jgi:hypothetical protein